MDFSLSGNTSKEIRGDHTKSMGDYGGNCGNMNMKGTNTCRAASTTDNIDAWIKNGRTHEAKNCKDNSLIHHVFHEF